MEDKIYKLGENEYVQREMVVGQLEQLGGVIAEIPFDIFVGVNVEALDPMAIRTFLQRISSDVLSKAMSIVLIPKDVDLADKKMEVVERDVKWHCSLETGADIIVDFFTANPPSKLSSIWQGSLGRIQALAPKATEEKSKTTSPTQAGQS